MRSSKNITSRSSRLRPVIPLRQQTRYAVLLTKRLKGTDGRAVRSPFPSVNHTLQNEELRPLFQHLPANLKRADIAFAWAFTTQTVVADLEAIANGMNARVGPPSLTFLFSQFPIQVGVEQKSGLRAVHRTAWKNRPSGAEIPGFGAGRSGSGPPF